MMRFIFVAIAGCLISVACIAPISSKTAAQERTPPKIAVINNGLSLVNTTDLSERSQHLDVSVDLLAYPSWSPDHTQLVFEVEDGSSIVLYSLDIESSELRRLTNDGLSLYPRWSPDGQTIAYISNDGTRWALHLMDTDGSHQRFVQEVALEGSGIGISWSPDGKSLAYVERGDIFVATFDSNQAVNLTEDLAFCGEGLFEILSLSWSQAHGKIAAFINCGGAASDLYVFSLDERDDVYAIAESQLILNKDEESIGTIGGFGGLDWSPDGTQLVFINTFNSEPQLYSLMVTVNYDTQSPKMTLIGISPMPFGYIHPAWQS